MKLAIGINFFGNHNRHQLCKQSLLKIKSKYPNQIDLFNLQFKDDENIEDLDGFKTIKGLTKDNRTLLNKHLKRRLPLLTDLFNTLSDLNYDYFCFSNNDILFSNRYFNFIFNNNYDCYPTTRVHIQPIKTLVDNIIPDRYDVAGFDTFTIKTNWWKNNKSRFPSYILGAPCWDVHYATLCMKFGKSTFCNKWPPHIFHLLHGEEAHDPCPEVTYNNDLFFKIHKQDADLWNKYLFDVLLKRPGYMYFTPHTNETELEQKYFTEHRI